MTWEGSRYRAHASEGGHSSFAPSSEPPPGSAQARYKRKHAEVEYMTNHYHKAPVRIVAWAESEVDRWIAEKLGQ